MMKRGEIYRADLDPVVGSEQGGIRPVVIVQNDIGNQHSTTVIVAAVTTSAKKAGLPVHVPVSAAETTTQTAVRTTIGFKVSHFILQHLQTVFYDPAWQYTGKECSSAGWRS